MNRFPRLAAAAGLFLAAIALAAQAPELKPVVKGEDKSEKGDDKVDKGAVKKEDKGLKPAVKGGDKGDDKQPKPTYISEFAGRSFDQWKADLKHADPSIRAEAIIGVSQFGSSTTEVVPLLLDRILDRDASPRVKAVMALTFIDIKDRDIPKVIDAMTRRVAEDTQAIIRYQALVALDQRYADHAHARNSVGVLLKSAADPSVWEIRRLSISCLRRCGLEKGNGPEARVSVALVTAAQDAASRVRLEAIISLGVMGQPTDPAIFKEVERALQLAVRDRDKVVGIWAQVSLMALADKVPDSMLHNLARGLTNSETRIRAQTVRAIGALKDRGKPCTPALLKALEDKDTEVIAEACMALANIGDKGEKVVKTLTDLSKNKEADENIRDLAKESLEVLMQTKKKPMP